MALTKVASDFLVAVGDNRLQGNVEQFDLASTRHNYKVHDRRGRAYVASAAVPLT
jgi:hypothetical protein